MGIPYSGPVNNPGSCCGSEYYPYVPDTPPAPPPFVLSGVVLTVDNVEELIAVDLSTLEGSSVMTLGYYEPNDGGGGYYWYNVDSSATENGGTVITPSSGNGRWELIHNGTINVRQFGAKGDAFTDDLARIQAAIDASIVPGDPTATTRFARNRLYIPKGTYILSEQLLFRSISSLILYGDGVDVSILAYIGDDDIDYMINMDGAKYCQFSSFGMTVDGSGTVSVMFWLHWDQAGGTNQSTTQNFFSHIHIRNGRWVTAWGVGEGAVQVDDCNWYKCTVQGQGETGSGPNDTVLWQHAWKFGDGTAGNNLDHSLNNCAWGHTRWGIWASSVNVWVYEFQSGATEVDFMLSGGNVHYTIQSGRLEGSKRFMEYLGGAGCQNVSVRDVNFTADNLHADGLGLIWAGGGGLSIDGFQVTGSLDFRMQLSNFGTDLCQFPLTNVAIPCAIDDLVTGTAGTVVIFNGYTEMTIGNVATALTPFAVQSNSTITYQVTTDGSTIEPAPEYADNAAALLGGLVIGNRYRTGDALKVVH